MVDLIIGVIIGIPLGILILRKVLDNCVNEEYKAWKTQNDAEHRN